MCLQNTNGLNCSLLFVCSPALDDAEDIVVHLKPLSKELQSIEELDFPEVGPHLPAIMHVLGLTYANCRAYATAPRVMNILTLICNQIIEQVGGCILVSFQRRGCGLGTRTLSFVYSFCLSTDTQGLGIFRYQERKPA